MMSTAAAVAVTSLMEASKASAQIVKADDPRVKAQMVTYPGEGSEMSGYLCKPADATGKLPSGGTVVTEATANGK